MTPEQPHITQTVWGCDLNHDGNHIVGLKALEAAITKLRMDMGLIPGSPNADGIEIFTGGTKLILRLQKVDKPAPGSIIARAAEEMRRAKFDQEDTAAMLDILDRFFARWDSGGAVWAAAPVLQRLIAGKCLTPLTGEDDEWIEVGTGVFQNKRISTVFKDYRFHGGKLAFDLDNPNGPREAISFPYMPAEAHVRLPMVEIGPDDRLAP